MESITDQHGPNIEERLARRCVELSAALERANESAVAAAAVAHAALRQLAERESGVAGSKGAES